MYKIALCGKANSGKDTAAKLIYNHLVEYNDSLHDVDYLAFANPIKEIAKIMFPNINNKHLYGSSKFRNTIIDGAFDKEGNPLTIRNLLLNIGTESRIYNESIWIDIMDSRIKKSKEHLYSVVIITDCRFIDEFFYLKINNFFMIKIERENNNLINHASEIELNKINNKEFNFILDNNGNLKDLNKIIKLMIPEMIQSL